MMATAGETPQPQPPEQPARAATAGFAAPVLRDDAIGAKGRSMLQKSARTPRAWIAHEAPHLRGNQEHEVAGPWEAWAPGR